MRVAFVGRRQEFQSRALSAPAGGLEPVFVDHPGGSDPAPALRALHRLAPDVVVVFRPELLPGPELAGLGALTLGFAADPLPRERPVAELVAGLPAYDRLVALDPGWIAAATNAGAAVWRSLPPPVDDALFDLAPRPPAHPPRVAFVGPSSEHRETWLTPVKHGFDVLHVVYGVHGDALRELLGRIDVGLVLHPVAGPGFAHQVLLHLAAGHLVISERLSPAHGLEAGVDYLEVGSPEHLAQAVESLHGHPGLHDAIRRRGRRKAEQFRASRVWPRLIADLVRQSPAGPARSAAG